MSGERSSRYPFSPHSPLYCLLLLTRVGCTLTGRPHSPDFDTAVSHPSQLRLLTSNLHLAFLFHLLFAWEGSSSGEVESIPSSACGPLSALWPGRMQGIMRSWGSNPGLPYAKHMFSPLSLLPPCLAPPLTVTIHRCRSILCVPNFPPSYL